MRLTNPADSSSARLASVQMLRGVAAAMVCALHFTCGAIHYIPDGHPVKRLALLGNYGVQIFFVISGFVLPYAMARQGYQLRNFGSFLLRRIVRIDPPYLASILVVLAVMFLSSIHPFYQNEGFQLDWLTALLHIGYLNPFFHKPWLNPAYWTLAIEFQFYILLGLLFAAFKDGSTLTKIALVVPFVVLAFVVQSYYFIFPHVPFFLSGIATCLFVLEKISWKQLAVCLIATTLVVGLTSARIAPAVLANVLSVAGILWLRHPWRPLMWLGEISYSLYLLHVPVGGWIIGWTEVSTSSLSVRLAMIPVAFVVSLVAAWLFYRAIERPAIQWSKQVRF
ncbi:MAG: acyltransferase [Cyclobacteriaceae bacterium]|nr:acyltransferase [Cyclobacteriaceae bacterium]